MSSKRLIAKLLEERRGEYVSGEEIAREIGITRSAVWKSIVTLREEGYQIMAMTNRGYQLNPECDTMSADWITSHLTPDLGFVRIEMHPSLASTNISVKERAESGEPEGLIICAAEQTSGKGRMGRTFFSPGGTGLYMSVLLRPTFTSELSTMITVAAAVAVARAIEEISDETAEIKWVNDIFVRGRKVCGILTEAAFSHEIGGLEYAVLGIGINVYEPKGGFPDELCNIAGALIKSQKPGVRNRLCTSIIQNFFKYYKSIEKREFIEEYRRRSLVLGKKVAVLSLSGEEKASATVVGIDDNCNLILRDEYGAERTISSGEVRVKVNTVPQ